MDVVDEQLKVKVLVEVLVLDHVLDEGGDVALVLVLDVELAEEFVLDELVLDEVLLVVVDELVSLVAKQVMLQIDAGLRGLRLQLCTKKMKIGATMAHVG